MLFSRWRRAWPVAALLPLVSILWMYTTDRWHPGDWLLPARYAGDALEVTARIQVAAEQGWRLGNTYGVIDRLGWPGGADWSLYPTPDRLGFWIAGRLAGAVGAGGALNLMMLAGYALGAGGFYLAARWLRWSRSWSLAGGLLFAFSYHNFRWADSLSLGLTFAWPATLVVLRWVTGRGPAVGSTRRWQVLAAVCGAVLGAGNPYFAFIAGQLGVWALWRQWPHRQAPRRLGAWCFLGALGLAFALTHAAYFAAKLGGEGPRIDRNFQGTELYALRPIEFLVPPVNHWSETLGRLGSRYQQESMFHGAEPPAYLGLIPLAGLGLLAAVVFRRLRQPRGAARILPESALAAGWVIAFAMVGGLNTLLGLAGIDLFRVSSRYSLVLMILGLFWCLDALRRRCVGRPRRGAVLAIGLTLFGLWDQLPPPPRTAERLATRRQLAQDQAVAATLQQAVGSSAAVFQLPATPFPEAGPRLAFNDYEHFRLFLHAPDLRLSYGGLADSYAARLGHWLERRPPEALPAALESGGFSAVVINRRAYRDHGDALAAAFEAAGRPRLALPEDSHLLAFVLSPADRFGLPAPDSPQLLEPWHSSARSRPFPRWRWNDRGPAPTTLGPRPFPFPLPPDRSGSDFRPARPPTGARPDRAERTAGPEVYARQGWLGTERLGPHQWRWSDRRDPVATLFTDQPGEHRVTLEFEIASLETAPVRILWRGAEIWSGTSGERPEKVRLAELELAGGEANDLEFRFDAPLARTRRETRALGLKVIGLTARYESRADPMTPPLSESQ